MSKGKGKNKASADKPAIRPPGRVLPGGHGPQSRAVNTATGSARLRKLLDVSRTCDIEQVCDDAATMIESFRKPGDAE